MQFSNVAAIGVVFPIIQSSPTFFAVGVKLSEGVSTIVLANWLVVMAAIIGKALQKVLFGELRLIEIEHIYEKSRFTVLNSLIALTMFSNDFLLIPGILTLFSLFMKVFHWVLEDRFDHIFQTATTPSRALKTRNTFTLLALLYVDFNLVYTCVEYSFGNNPDVYFAFGFEFAVLFLDLLLQLGKVVLNTWELVYLGQHPDEDVMESKALYMRLLKICHKSLVLIIHIFLLVTLLSPYRYPIYLFKDIFFNIFGLLTDIRSFLRYQKAAKELNAKLADATPQDLERDNLCIICMDEMDTTSAEKGTRLYPKRLNCGHVFHLGCLKGWFERSQQCPTCRAPVFGNDNLNTNETQHNAEEQQHQQHNDRMDTQHEVPARGTQPLGPPPFMNQHLPHGAGFFNSPTSTSTVTGTQRNNEDNTLRLRPNSLVPPDWTLLKLSNASPNNDEYQVKLNDSVTAQIKKISQEQKIEPLKFSKRTGKQDEDNSMRSDGFDSNESLKLELQKIREEMKQLQADSKEMKEKVEKRNEGTGNIE